MRTSIDKKAVSILVLVILMLLSAVFGGIVTYLGVLTNYYNMPENTSFLIVEDAVFPLYNATYFNVTILNPSNSLSDLNITMIRVSVVGTTQVYDVNITEPELALLRRGTRQTFKCKRNWSNFAGETVTIEPIYVNASIESRMFATPNVKLKVTPTFDPSISIDHFNLTVENLAQSKINLTISDIKLFQIPLNSNVTPTIDSGYVLSNGSSVKFKVDYNWENLRGQNATITVETVQGYEATYTTNALLGAILDIQQIRFNELDTSRFNVTVRSSEDSTATATVSKMNLTLEGGNIVVINNTIISNASFPLGNPSVEIYFTIPKNTSKTFTCIWNWTSYRDKNVTVSTLTKEGFVIPNKTELTLPATIWHVAEVIFDHDDTNHFLVNVTNAKTSLNNITITGIFLNQTSLTINQTVLQPNEQKIINCTIDWKDFIGKNATVIVERDNLANISRTIKISVVGLKILGETLVHDHSTGQYFPIPYVNITISNSNSSLVNVTITQIRLLVNNVNHTIDNYLTSPEISPNGYLLKIGETVTITCFWDWVAYPTTNPIEVIVYTQEGFQVSKFQNP